jgi:hypothetical protein
MFVDIVANLAWQAQERGVVLVLDAVERHVSVHFRDVLAAYGSETYNMLVAVAVASNVAIVGIGAFIVDLIVEVEDVDSEVEWCACECVC